MGDTGSRSWDRQRDGDGRLEPNLWYDRFTQYRLMGPGRSLLGCVNDDRDKKGQKRSNRIPGSWRRKAEEWRWKERAEAWDEAERERQEEEQERERLEWRRRRRQLLQGYFGELAKLLSRAFPEQATLGQVTGAVKVAVHELREEYDDLPTQRHEVKGSIAEVRIYIPDNGRGD